MRVAHRCDSGQPRCLGALCALLDEVDDMEGNTPLVCRLLSCERPLVLNDKQLPSLAVASERLKAKVMPHISEDMVAKAVLSILYIISQDNAIGVEHKENFKKWLGMYKDDLLQQTKFNVPDFL